jgi:hypothetical protein
MTTVHHSFWTTFWEDIRYWYDNLAYEAYTVQRFEPWLASANEQQIILIFEKLFVIVQVSKP